MDGLSLENISHRFASNLVVDALSLEVNKGEIVCLLGPSGCGKTTTLRIAAGLEALQAGRIVIGDAIVAEPGREVPTEHRGIGLVFQDYALFPHLTVAENVEFGLSKLKPEERRRRGDALLKRLDIERYRDAYPHVLSGGEQQRVALARALVAEPTVMLMDEPFANLDVRLRDRVRDDTLRLLREEGSATLLVTHDPEEAMLMADRIAVMRQGRIIQVGTPEALFDRPACRFVAEFFGELNVVEGQVVAPGKIRSSLGEVAVDEARGFQVGDRVDVLVRPDSLRLSPNGAGIAATVTSTRAVGAFSLAEFKLTASGESLKGRFAGKGPVKCGESVGLESDPAQTFVFSPEKA